jgi:hypothetical protein
MYVDTLVAASYKRSRNVEYNTGADSWFDHNQALELILLALCRLEHLDGQVYILEVQARSQ